MGICRDDHIIRHRVVISGHFYADIPVGLNVFLTANSLLSKNWEFTSLEKQNRVTAAVQTVHAGLLG